MKKLFTVILAIGFLTVFSAGAAVITQDTWTGAGSLDGWRATNSPARNGPGFGTLGNTSGFLGITGGTNAVGVKEDFIGEAGGNLSGNMSYTNVGAIQFDFLAQAGGTNQLPGGLQAYFISSNSVLWYYNIPSVAAGWNTYYANMYFGGWYNMQGRNTSAYFLQDLMDVDEVGIVLQYHRELMPWRSF